jgi:hypothetical protein
MRCCLPGSATIHAGMALLARLLAVVIWVAAADAAEEFMLGFDPRPTPPGIDWRASAEVRGYAEAAARDGAGSLLIDREQASLSWLALRGAEDEVWLRTHGTHIAVSGDARLSSGASPAGDYYELGATTSWKHLLGGGNLVGGMATLSREGQAPLSRGMEWGANANVYGRIALGEYGRDGLLLALNYDADRNFFGNVPLLPLVAWQGMRGPWMLLLGVPFTVVSYRAEDWRVNAVVGPLPSLSADHRLHGPLRAVADMRWSTMQMRRADRTNHDDRLTLSQWEWSGGLRCEVGPAIGCDLVAGMATARRLGENQDDGDARRDGIALEAAPFAAFRGRIAF